MAMQLKIPDIRDYLEPRATTLEELQEFVAALDNQMTQDASVAALHELARQLPTTSAARGLRLFTIQVPGVAEPLRLILHPAVFEPEQWGQTFAEGLLKETDIFQGKTVVELGCGSGWISLVLAKRTYVKHILGLDLNPIAVPIARINVWLNGTTSDGQLINTPWGAPLVEALRMEQSDLLQEPLSRKERFDHVVGCIPQVLHPDPGSLKIKQGLSTRDLYDLSNYCFQQGILEDRFGLPLIARALEQAQLCLTPGGLVTLIVGGRPGQEAIDGVFRRRGYDPSLWWSRRIQQADDTDLASLVALEKEHGIKFHFFASNSSKHSIPASTAVGLLERGQPLYHDLLVVQARTRFEKPMLSFVKNISALGLTSLRKELDLSRVTDEQISFLERLTVDMLRRRTLPYTHERGDYGMRAKIARFLRIYGNYLTSAEDLFIGPERSQLVDMILAMVARPGDKVLLSGALDKVYGKAVARQDLEAVLGNDDLSELVSLDTLFSPRISLLAPSEMSDPSPLVMDAFVKQARANPDRWYVVDDSANFGISSELKANVMMRILAQHELPPNLIFLYGLIKNTVCPDLELSFMINAPDSWIHGLEIAAELSYSRIAYTTQLYYEWLFEELLSFPFADNRPSVPASSRREADGVLTDWFKEIAVDPVFGPKPDGLNDEREVVRLDYGEFEAPVPSALVRGIIKGFLEPHSDDVSEIVRSRVQSYLRFTRGCSVAENRIVLGAGVFPLFGNLIETLRKRLGRSPIVALPTGSYGPSYALIRYHGGTPIDIPTDADQGFLLTLHGIARMTEKPDLLWLTQPNNPSGLFFDSDTVAGIMQLCVERGIYVLADEIFFLLSDPKVGPWTPPSLSFVSHVGNSESKWLFCVDGLSKSFAAGGLRCGFMMCPDETWASEIQATTQMPPTSILRAWDSLYSAFLEEPPHNLMDLQRERAEVESYLQSARGLLADQRERLLALLSKHNVADKLDNAKRGGLFVIARVSEKRNKLAASEKLLINSDEWARIPGWSRICFSLEPARFNAALQRLERFLQNEYPA